MKKEFILDFFLFDEGGEGTGETASSSGSAQDNKPKVIYGKSEGNGPDTSQVGTDTRQTDEAEFAALIGKGGRFHDIYGQKVSSAIQERFKNQSDLQGQVDQISEKLSPLFMNYGLDSGDFEGLGRAIANDEDFYKAGAERAGLEIDQYKENLRLKAEAERGRRISEAFQEQQRQQELFAQWESDTAELQKAFPNFDLGNEINSNAQFKNLLNNGVDVRTAFISTHMDEFLTGANAYAERTATQKVVDTIQHRASRPAEGALNHSPAYERRSDPSKLTDADLDEINRIVAEGGSVTF